MTTFEKHDWQVGEAVVIVRDTEKQKTSVSRVDKYVHVVSEIGVFGKGRAFHKTTRLEVGAAENWWTIFTSVEMPFPGEPSGLSEMARKERP